MPKNTATPDLLKFPGPLNPEMQPVLDFLRAQPFYKALLETPASSGLGIPRAVRLPLLAALRADLGAPILLLTDRSERARRLADELAFWSGGVPPLLFPAPEPLFYENAPWGETSRRERIRALTLLAQYHLPFVPSPEPFLLVAPLRAAMTRTLPRRDFLKASSLLRRGQTLLPRRLLETWGRIGYERVETVVQPGQFAHRGGILDIWTPSEAFPVRLDFFGDELDSIRRYDPVSQRTLQPLDSVLISPAREYLRPEGSDAPLSEFDIPRLHPLSAALPDYLPPHALVALDDESLLWATAEDIETRALALRRESIENGTLPQDVPIPYLTWSELEDRLPASRRLNLGGTPESALDASDSIAASFSPPPRFGGRLKSFLAYLEEETARRKAVFVVSRQCERLEELWRARRVENAPGPRFVCASLSGGVLGGESLALLTDAEIFGWERPAPRRAPRPAIESPEAAYADLSPGDWVVHVDYGIGQYRGVVRRSLDGFERDFLFIEYKDGDELFVPVHQADRLTRYVGVDSSPPSPTRLSGGTWSQVRGRVKEAVRQVAEDLLALYARRQLARGFAFSPDTPWQMELEASFPYIETEDQLRALREIKRDMESPRPMDRLLCGDVGYGKTEIALRAAFKAVMDGKQVAMLVPTTVLAQQHYETFRKRLAAFPVTVEMLSRFRTPKEQEKILYGLALGAVDILIGTHRLLQPDVEFKDLGLVIIDEEQRFGVAHKEYLKKLRAEVDVLTMTATPIPRTLYMALTGVRDISNLDTPPEERLPVATHVGPYSPTLVQRAIRREMERGGQVFFVHNRVQTIRAMKAHLQRLVPEAQIGIAHGQMREKDLAAVMRRFSTGELDVLLSTSIIESGLDIPNANTLIVDRGDTFGLAQLYQLRGRVGRGAARAYAYFFRHRKKLPTTEGQARLETLAEHTHLGAGYSIAMRDLELRGAGDLLGTRQHGHIAAVGFHLYTRLLSEAVTLLKSESDSPLQEDASSRLFQPIPAPVSVDLPLDIGIPSDYIPEGALRLRLYRRLADAPDDDALDSLEEEFADRFGALPEMTRNLFYQLRVRRRAEAAGLAAISVEGKNLLLRYPPRGKNAPPLPKRRGLLAGKNAYRLPFTRGDESWKSALLAALERLSLEE